MDWPTTSVTELAVLDIQDTLVAGEEAAVRTGMASRSVTDETISLDSTPDSLAERPADVAQTGYSSVAAGRVSNMLMGGAAAVESEVTEGLGVMDLEGATVEEVGSSVSAAVPVGFAEMLAVGDSAPLALASGIEGLMLSSASVVGAVAAALALAESVHMPVSEGSTVREGAFESGTESETVVTEGGVVAGRGRAAVATAGLTLVAVLSSPSSIWDSSFSGVLRPDVVGGGPGLRTGFGSKAGFPADSCADTLGRI